MHQHPTKTNNVFRQLHTPQSFPKFGKLQCMHIIRKCFMTTRHLYFDCNNKFLPSLTEYWKNSICLPFSIDNQLDPSPNCEEDFSGKPTMSIITSILERVDPKTIFSGIMQQLE